MEQNRKERTEELIFLTISFIIDLLHRRREEQKMCRFGVKFQKET
jgi:hypothetical protein